MKLGDAGASFRFNLDIDTLDEIQLGELYSIKGVHQVYVNPDTEKYVVTFVLDRLDHFTPARIYKAANEIREVFGQDIKALDNRTEHTWMSGPDGPGYHCPICGISKCDDYGFFSTCESWVLEQAERIRRGMSLSLAQFEMDARLWSEWL